MQVHLWPQLHYLTQRRKDSKEHKEFNSGFGTLLCDSLSLCAFASKKTLKLLLAQTAEQFVFPLIITVLDFRAPDVATVCRDVLVFLGEVFAVTERSQMACGGSTRNALDDVLVGII